MRVVGRVRAKRSVLLARISRCGVRMVWDALWLDERGPLSLFVFVVFRAFSRTKLVAQKGVVQGPDAGQLARGRTGWTVWNLCVRAPGRA